MNRDIKDLVCGLLVSATILGVFGLMTNCAITTSRTGSAAVAACLHSGGTWIGDNQGLGPEIDSCSYPQKAGRK